MSGLTKEWLQNTITSIESARDEIPFGLDEEQSNMLAAFEIALASLESEPVSPNDKLNELSNNSPVTPDGWISCNEQMPEHNTHVLICTIGGYMYVASFNNMTGWDDGDFLSNIEGVTHWMKLPEPPQEVK